MQLPLVANPATRAHSLPRIVREIPTGDEPAVPRWQWQTAGQDLPDHLSTDSLALLHTGALSDFLPEFSPAELVAV